MEQIVHLFLVKASSLEEAVAKVEKFLTSYQLVRYEKFWIDREASLPSQNSEFFISLQEVLRENQKILISFLEDLQNEGFSTVESLKSLPQGYLSKLLHLIAHFLDGFFGVDSYFYNLEEDSHFITPYLEKKILKGEEKYFLVKAYGYLPKKEYLFEALSPKRFFKVY